MIFDDIEHNLRIKFIDATCKVSMLSADLNKLRGISRMLNFAKRGAALDGGDQPQFSHNLDINRKQPYILITGNLVEAINILCELEFISENIRNEFAKETANIISDIPTHSFQL